MKKKILVVFIAICLIMPCTFAMSACDDGITDCAYVQFVPAVDGEVVQYAKYVYEGDDLAHIYLFESEEKKNEEVTFGEKDYLLKITFNRGFGVDSEIDEKETFVAGIEGWSGMEISIKKEYFDASKKVYLNGVDITSKADPTVSTTPKEDSHALGTFWHDAVYYFEDFGLVKGNTSEYINIIEYK